MFSLPPAKVDQEIRLLCLHEQDVVGLQLLKCLLQLIFSNSSMTHNFDLIHSYLHRILALHGSKLSVSFDLLQAVETAKDSTETAVIQLQALVYTALCILKTTLNIQLV